MSHAPPPGPPPNRPTNNDDPFHDTVPDDPPPAYEAVSRTDSTVAAGPSRMDFSGPPPLPDRMRIQPHSTGGYSIPGVGVGYSPSPTSPGGQGFSSGYATPTHAPPPGAPPPPPPPPRHPNPPNQEFTPTESPVPGRPLLHNGNLLVYPKGYWCHKCQNTGYKGGDARAPCNSDWRKYGKPYNGALAASFAAPRPGGNASVVGANNFQRPLPGHAAGHTGQAGQAPHYALGHQGGGYPGQQVYQRPPMRHTYAPPPGALVVQPGDPRIGGQLCYRCGGSGRETSLFMFDDGPCWQCRGVGRVF
ncbi:unnamed protein product [Cutaneotrichosporon oleaginosum]